MTFNNVPPVHVQPFETGAGMQMAYELGPRDIAQWNPTVSQVRDCLLSRLIGAPGWGRAACADLSPELFLTQQDVKNYNDMALAAVSAGRLVDFGYLSLEVIADSVERASELYAFGGSGHPFRDPWVLFFTTELRPIIFLVRPLDPERLNGGSCELAELIPANIKARRMLLVGDRGSIEAPQDAAAAPTATVVDMSPSPERFMPGNEELNFGFPPHIAAASNLTSAVLTCLMILSTDGVGQETVTPPEKLNRARVKSGKKPIPPHRRVLSGPYVTALMAKQGGRSEGKGGTHASPIPHLRRGHMRTYTSGMKVFVRDCLVNVTDEARAQFQRTHYAVRA